MYILDIKLLFGFTGSGTIIMSQLNCSGAESDLYQCDYLNQDDSWKCAHEEDAGVVCIEGNISLDTNNK